MLTTTKMEILRILPSAGWIGSAEIVERLRAMDIRISQRSVQRNLKELEAECGVICDGRHPAGWRKGVTQNLPANPIYDVSTAVTFCLADTYLSPLLPPGVMKNFRPYVYFAQELLEKDRQTQFRKWTQKVARIGRSQPLIPPEVCSDVTDAVYQAVIEERQLEVWYRRIGLDAERKMMVHPYGIVFRDGVIYMIGRVDGYEDLRQFALHRMLKAEISPRKIQGGEDFSIQQYIEAGKFDFVDSAVEKIQVKLRTDEWLGEYLTESRLSADQQVTRDDAGYVVDATVLNTLQFKWWLLGMGTQVEVIEPEVLRLSMKKTISEMKQQYDCE